MTYWAPQDGQAHLHLPSFNPRRRKIHRLETEREVAPKNANVPFRIIGHPRSRLPAAPAQRRGGPLGR